MPPKASGAGARRRPANPGAASSDSATPGPAAGAPAPTPDPASSAGNTPNARGQVQRLQSVRRRAPTGSLVPLNPDGSAPKPTLRFQPKVVQRRSKEEREEKERLEAERQQERVAEAAESRRRALRGNDRPRGGARGRGPAGPRGRWRDRGGPPGRITEGPAGGKVKREPQRGAISGISTEHEATSDGYPSSDESDSLPRYNIDHINQISDSEDEEEISSGIAKGKTRAKFAPRKPNPGLRPVRVERYDHVERAVNLNTEASSSKAAEIRQQADERAVEDDSLFVEQDEPQGVEEVAAGRITEEAPQIKPEPSDNDISMIDSIPSAAPDDETAPPADEAAPETVKLKKKEVTIDDPRSKLQTVEERREYDRYAQDVEYLRTLLGDVSVPDKGPKTAEGDDQTEANETKADDVKNERQGKLFLFQFPPMTPKLTVPVPEADNQDNQEDHDGVTEVPAPPPPPPPQSEPPQQSSEPQPPVTLKTEDGNGAALASAPPASTAPRLLTSTNSELPPGRVGKLQVRKSGAATIDWGGISLDLNMGSDVNFLQDAIVLSDDKTDKRIWAMSQVSGKFIVTPNWDELLSG